MKTRLYLTAEARARLIDWLSNVLQPGLDAQSYAEVLETAHQLFGKPAAVTQVLFEVPGRHTRSGEAASMSFSVVEDFRPAAEY